MISPPFISLPAQESTFPATVILPPFIFAPRCMSALPLIMIRPAVIPSPILFTREKSPSITIFTSAGAPEPSTLTEKRSPRETLLFPIQTSMDCISFSVLPANLSGEMFSASTEISISLFGLMFTVCISAHLHRNQPCPDNIRMRDICILHHVVCKVYGIIVLEFQANVLHHHFSVLIRHRGIDPEGSSHGGGCNLTVLYHDLAAFDRIGSRCEGALYLRMLDRWIDLVGFEVVYRHICISAGTEMTFGIKQPQNF